MIVFYHFHWTSSFKTIPEFGKNGSTLLVDGFNVYLSPQHNRRADITDVLYFLCKEVIVKCIESLNIWDDVSPEILQML